VKNTSFLTVLLAILLSAGMWFYFDQVLVPYQVRDSGAHQRPRGNLSDLYPRWLGARELLLRGRNPYSPEITREIQMGYYGRALDPANPGDPQDQQAFAYPVYVVFLLAPTVKLPFEMVCRGFDVLLWILTGASVLLWLKAIGWRVTRLTGLVLLILTLGSLPVVQGIKLQQLTLVVAALLAAASACAAGGQFVLAGILLGTSTIKPQLALLPILGSLAWVLGDWRRRRGLFWGLAATLLLLLGGARLILPDWIPQFWLAMQRYHEYTHSVSIPSWLWGERLGNWISALLIVISCLLMRRQSRSAEGSVDFARGLALVFALTALLVPMFATYNQVLLIPALLVLFREGRELTGRKPWIRGIYVVAALALFWPWIASLLLMFAAGFLPGQTIQNAWKMPLATALLLPPLVFALILFDTWKAGGSHDIAELS
jgi:hypothetical protein